MHKRFAALAAAWCFGAWSAIRWTGNTVLSYQHARVEPAWVAEVNGMETLAVVGVAVCALGWVALDCRMFGPGEG